MTTSWPEKLPVPKAISIYPQGVAGEQGKLPGEFVWVKYAILSPNAAPEQAQTTIIKVASINETRKICLMVSLPPFHVFESAPRDGNAYAASLFIPTADRNASSKHTPTTSQT